MFLLKLKVNNKLTWYIFSFSLLLLSACNSRIGYNLFGAINTDLKSMKKNISDYQTRYSNLVEPYWNDVISNGFLTDDGNRNQYDLNQNNNMERGLGYIFFNTLRARLNRSVNHEDVRLWNGKYTNFRCPRPWKYRADEGRGFGYFSLDCVQMGEYFYGIDQAPVRNFDRIYSGRAPYMRVCYTDDNEERSRNFVLNIDHLLRDNSYLIELPKVLHDLKTRYLDPFITFRTETNRDIIPTSTYWRSRPDYIEALGNRELLDQCSCLEPFQTPRSEIITEHIHNVPWKTNWGANMMVDNILRPNR
ncbi:hypothetical protein [Candidatus Cardinium sp. TP]|uniref:hypothetical protein n=1 Tax=Candidatus Cardinium sp. TP TaxID=2961955 RepID=UPI0021AE5EFF|nr:hypothetical protein [Candidatus Cardinium sp. TP]MCT4697363.1 hypothetical protein [Candidatus Cardinium sp. TP]